MKDNGSPRRASEWLAALLERPDDLALRRRFDAWLAADPVHRADWAEMARTYEVMGRTAPQHRGEWAGWAATRERPRRLPHANSSRASLRRSRTAAREDAWRLAPSPPGSRRRSRC